MPTCVPLPRATPEFSANISRQQPRQIELPGEDMDAVGCFLEFLYTGEYFPRKVAGQRVLEPDPSLPAVDDTGDQLLKHARVYTLAEKFGVERLQTLASSKIHCVNSTAKGEIAYARYVYAYTGADDKAVRAPIASFWATRSHTLRAEAEDEFKSLCLEYPQFGYDVLSRWLPCWRRATAVVVLGAVLTVLGSAGPGRQAQEGAQREDAPGHGQWAEEGPKQQHFPTGLDGLGRLLGGKARWSAGQRSVGLLRSFLYYALGERELVQYGVTGYHVLGERYRFNLRNRLCFTDGMRNGTDSHRRPEWEPKGPTGGVDGGILARRDSSSVEVQKMTFCPVEELSPWLSRGAGRNKWYPNETSM